MKPKDKSGHKRGAIMKIFFCWLLTIGWAFPGELRVLSYNIHHGKGMDGNIDLKRIANVIQKVDPDFVALQEVDKNVNRSGKVDQAKILGNMLKMDYAFAKFTDYDEGEYGLAVLSKYKILNTFIHKLPDGAEPRVVLEVEVAVEERRISFASIHLDWTKESLRVSQFKTLNKKLIGRDHPIIVAGDYNAIPEAKTMGLVERSGEIVPKTGNPLTWPADKPNVEIDYIVVRGLLNVKATSRVIVERIASDHRPVMGVIQWP